MIKNIVLILSILLLSIFLVGTAYIFKNKDICCQFSICKQITDICTEENSENNNENEEVQEEVLSVKGTRISMLNVKNNDTVTVGDTISGSVDSSWYFEGDFPVRVLNSKGEVFSTLNAMAQEEWTQEGEVPFEFVLSLDIDSDMEVILRFEKSNPSGLVQNEDSADIKLLVKPLPETMTLKVYLPNMDMGSTDDCSLVFPVNRVVEKTVAVGRASLEELFKGTTEEEENQGYFTNINDGVIIQSLEIKNGVAKVDLSKELEEGVGGSCKVTSIRASITETLKQFSTVDSVVISIDGRTEDILQP